MFSVPVGQVLQRPQHPHRIVSRPHHPAGVLDERLAGFGQRHVVQVAREQRHAELVFELLDALADGRLRAPDTFRRAGERAFFGDGEKVFELQQIHSASPAV